MRLVYALCLFGLALAVSAEAGATETSCADCTDVIVDTDEGTWLNLDVSPDGDRIAFDFLGDIFVMPASGGEARALTSGSAWDMQPRFGPGGREIAFISDQGGADNLWVMALQDGTLRQASHESRDFVSSPVWHPDGEHIAVRKQPSDRSVLGSGEIWVYPRLGGDGRKIVDHPKYRKDLGEPAYSADGRYLYFSEDTTPPFFVAKYAGEQIYEIKKLELGTGRIANAVGRAIRPTPSPDGKMLAFVRRDGARSNLLVKDLRSGAERVLYADLDADLQGLWGYQGVYPAMAWTPDGQAVVFWAGGKIRRADAHGGDVTVIPFRVRQTHRVTTAPRFSVAPFSEHFDVRMLRSIDVSPDGKHVVYEALGRVYLRSLADGSSNPLPAEADTFQFHPSFSPDGKAVVFAAWNDRRLGAIRVFDLAARKARTVTSEPGRYVEPRFDPTGKAIVFRRVQAGPLTGPDESQEAGIFTLALDGRAAERVTRSGVSPQFGPDGERLYFSSPNGRPRHNGYSLASVSLDGSDLRVHVASNRATAYRISPDGMRIAVKAGFHLYVMPLQEVSEPVSLGEDCQASTCRRITRHGAEEFAWAGNDRLYWTLGPDLYRYDAEAEAPSPQDPTPIGFSERSSAPQGKLALVGGKVITMEGGEIIPRGAVLIGDNRILRVGAAGSFPIPDDARILDTTGKTIIPGLVDVHWHGRLSDDSIMPQRNWNLLATLAFGVTTIHDPSHDTGEIFAAAERVKAGRVIGPRIFATGSILYGYGSARRAMIDSPDDARGHLIRLKSAGAFTAKSYSQPRRDQRQFVIAAARELDMRVVLESPGTFGPIMSAVLDGHTGIEHALPVKNIYDDVLQFWSGTDVAYTPTLTAAYSGLYGKRYWSRQSDVTAHPLLRRYVPRSILEKDEAALDAQTGGIDGHIASARIVKRLYDKGVSIQMGSHGEREGLGAHWEMWSLVQGGMTPLEALQVSTINGAKYLGLDEHIGSLKPGKLADIAVLNSDPSRDIRHSDDIQYVIVNGRLYDVFSIGAGPDPG